MEVENFCVYKSIYMYAKKMKISQSSPKLTDSAKIWHVKSIRPIDQAVLEIGPIEISIKPAFSVSFLRTHYQGLESHEV